jgi:hypothetical protein
LQNPLFDFLPGIVAYAFILPQSDIKGMKDHNLLYGYLIPPFQAIETT